MNNMKLQLFLNSREYRGLRCKIIKLNIKKWIINSWIMKPFNSIKSIYYTIKLYIDYPDSWDRYVKINEMTHESELELEKAKEKNERFTAHYKFIVAVGTFELSLAALITYFSNFTMEKYVQESYDDLCSKFHQAKDNIIKSVRELEGMNVYIPDELKTMIESTDEKSFTNVEEYKAFYSRFDAIVDEVIP